MNCSISWEELLILQSLEEPAACLKMMSEVWGVKIKSIVEIGVYQGRTSKLSRLFFPEASLYLIDPWKLYDEYLSEEAVPISKTNADYENAYQSLKELFSQDPKTKILRKTSMEALADVPGEVDLVFIDGNHSYPYVKQDIEHWFPKVRPGGMISGHDYSDSFPGVMQAVDEFFPQGVVVGRNYSWIYT